ncbi:trichohyalin isoform X1 [Bactrocera tryoni]|uniref:trichohyalin isoform X1 n=1 Tax=Bactrocera tryoni TaxID=59916 RepID=UPI001A9A223F|nr:trichohyalin isoform X1 [Bactrocera tryoni]XP_039963675.1 trichohyalin isoform X1 [Bactrocera tryoni]
MGDELLPELGDLVFSVLIGYAGALEFLYVVRHLYHWSCGHMNTTQNDAESLQRLQQRMRNELTAAESKERQVGTEVMKDGVLYKDGFRIDAEQLERDRLKAAQSTPEAREKRKKEIELELRRQKEIEDETRKQLAEAEAKLAEQRAAAEELEAQQRAEEERKLLEAEREREEQQKREEEQKEAAEEARKLLEIERLREEEERRREVEEKERKEREVAEAKKAEEQRRRQQEEEARIAAEEEELRRQQEAELVRKAAEEEERLKRQEEEIAAARIAAEEEELRRQEEEETARLRAEEEALRRQEEETARLAVEEETRQHLEVESVAAEQKRAEEEEDLERQAVEIEEQTIKLIEAERQRELEQLSKEMEDSERATQKEIDEEAETIENERKLLEAERLREAEQRNQELEEWESKINTEDHMEDSVYKNEVYASSNPKKTDEAETLDSIMQLLDAESERNLREKEFEERAAQERLERQKIIEENARKFLEADHEMEELLETVQKQRRLSATESAPQSPVFEEPCVKKTMSPLSDNSDSGGERLTQTVKTQFGQTSNEPYSLTTKPLLFKSISDDTPSFEPQSSLSVQPSEEYDIDRDGTTTEHKIDVQFAQLERQEPEGGEENDTATSTQYTEDYLRSLDGIKQRPLVREDGSGRRRAFKKRRSSGSSNSSFDSRASREEEVKMFTSLEEEELQPKKEGDTDFTPITYASEPLLKVKMPRRRHKRSPAKDAKPSDNNVRGSLEMLDEEANTNPWGEVTPEHYKDMPFWKREKSMSIDEEAIELEPPAKKTETEKDNNARNVPQTAAFEEATHTQNEEAITAIKRQQTKEEQDNAAQKPDSVEPTRSDIQSNLTITHEVSPDSPGGRKSASPRLRRSPRIEEMDQYEELWNKTNQSVAADEVLTPNTPSTPSITLDKSPDIAPWRDDYGLLMEGLSDFYDFTASVNPSRSRSTSRQASPASSQLSTPLPKNVEFVFNEDRSDTLEIYDDTGSVLEAELTKENVVEFIESLQSDCVKLSQTIGDQLKIVADSPNVSREGSEGDSQNEMRLLVQTLRVERQSRSHSRSPLPTPDNIERSLETRRTKRIRQNDELGEKLGLDSSSSRTTSPTESPVELSPDPLTGFEEEHSKESMNLLVQSLRVERTQTGSRSRSRSPLPTAENLRTGLEHRRKKKIQHNDELFQQLHINIPTFTEDSHNVSEQRKAITAPVISIQCCDEEHTGSTPDTAQEESEYSLESMTSLVESLRLQRSRSKSPMRRLERERTPDPSNIRVGIMEPNQTYEDEDEHERRSRTPSRSVSVSPTRISMDSPSQPVEEIDFHVMLNLEASQNRTLSKCSEEIESILAEKQRQVDADALRKLSNASEEIELRIVTPVSPLPPTDKDKLMTLPVDERMRQLRCSPTTPDYDRTISQEWSDVQRIKDEMLVSGFKRSTYVGESLDLGSEFVPLREQTARFRRSRSPSPSLIATEPSQIAGERRQVQDKILAELISASEQVAVEERLGAKPKELRDTKSKEKQQYEELRRMNANFQRSRSQSRSPLGDIEAKEVARIEEEATKRELQDRKADLEKANINFQEFSRYLNAGFLDNERRASDSALIQKPEIIVQLQELEEDFELEPENYHHFRRFSLNQEQSIEEYPNDDYVYVSQIEVQTPSGTRTWIREDYYSEDFDKLNFFAEESDVNVGPTIGAYDEVPDEQLQVAEDEETDGSEDERQTVVDVDDEIDEDICDFNERGPADESHHEQSECEEAEREMDHYAGRDADDWQRVENIDELLEDQILLANEEGAVGGAISALDYDSDSAAIDEIYDEAIKNRKQSGILRDYDSILNEMQKNYLNKEISADGSEGDVSGTSDTDRTNKAANKRNEHTSSLKLISNERREREQRYLGDASVAERQSTRLRTRYGYAPQLNVKGMEDLDIEVDLSYTPKKEYNWRKNFKIDEDEENSNKTQYLDEEIKSNENMNSTNQYLDSRKFSLGGESITLFSRGAEGVCYLADEDQQNTETIAEAEECSNELNETLQLEAAESSLGKSKKKKSKKKLRKDSKGNSIEFVTKDDDDSESHIHSSTQSAGIETDSPKRIKARSRRNSRNSLTNEETNGAPFSPRSSIVDEEPTDNLLENSTATVNNKKKLKKRKKTKETFATTESDIKEEFAVEGAERSSYFDLTVKVPTASAAVSPGRISINPLATLSPQNSICTPSSSLDYETPELKELNSAASSAEGSPKQQEVDTPAVEARISAAADALTTPAATTTTPEAIVTVATRSSITPTTTTKTTVDTFDILKDANFYPLF